jgi:hypothetical protein
VPLDRMWLTKIRVDSTAGALKYDLAIDPTGAAEPSAVDAGFTLNGLPKPQPPDTPLTEQIAESGRRGVGLAVFALVVAVLGVAWVRSYRGSSRRVV